jgi:hypothetical protein
MFGGENQKVIGACVVGLALVAGAYTVSNFGKQTELPAIAVYSKAMPRVAVKTEDKDNNGIEDWRDTFVSAKPVVLDKASTAPYSIPTTTTDILGINLFQSIVNAHAAGPFGKTKDQIVNDAANDLAKLANDTIFDVKDVTIIQNWNDNDVKNYANTMAGIVLNVDVKPKSNEAEILNDIVTRGNSARMGELKEIAVGYKTILDNSKTVPVPAIFVKQHLDLLNSYNALSKDIAAMTLVDADPALTLVRLRRYADDATGLKLSMEEMNSSLKPYYHLFGGSDQAIFFADFSPDNQKP